jgi:LmbE family N-acetylglucosaminyl deacetylase
MSFTLVAFHAHPDDEAIATAGTMARAKAEGHRVVLVLATRGELGEHDPALLADGETISDRRVAEVTEAAKILGVDRLEFLGYRDSGMIGEPTNDDADAFAAADVEQAATRLAGLLAEEHADVLTIYDDHGVYGHPDHVQVHTVGVRAAELAGGVQVVESTMNRDFLLQLMSENADTMSDVPDSPDPADFQDFGSPEAIITTKVDVRDYVELKRAAMAAHGSQIPADSFFMQMPLDAFREAFGYEWFIRRGAPPGLRETSVFEGLGEH